MNGTTKKHANRRRRAVLRTRIFMVILAISIAFGVGMLGTYSFVDAHDSSYSVESNIDKYYKSIELKKGDTLWNIAETYMDESYDSVEDYISELKKLNNLTTDEIHEGNYLMVAYNK